MQQQYATIFACREMIQIEDGWMVWSVVEQNSDFRVLSTSRFRHKCQQMKITDHYGTTTDSNRRDRNLFI
eukprot:scaffold2473_cov214-Chaetoceros_neogracile.AAC.41